MKEINPEHIQAILQLINNSPYFQLIGMRLTEMKSNYARVELTMDRDHCNPFGSIHGGVYAALIDTATYWSAYYDMPEDTGFTSIDVSVNNLFSLREGKIVVEGKTIKSGRSLCIAEATAWTEEGKMLAFGTSKMMLLKDRQSIRQLAAAAGSSLPPKFKA